MQLEELKNQPTEEMIAWMETHPEYKSWNCSALAAYSGLSEPTLKKLKSGVISDPRGSTFWILSDKFGIRPRDVLAYAPSSICADAELQEAKDRIAELEAASKVDKMSLAERNERFKRTDEVVDDLRRDLKTLRRYNVWLLLALVALVVALLVIYLVWEFRNPGQGLTGLIRSLTQ